MIRITIFLIFTFTLNAQVITNNSFNSSNSIAMAELLFQPGVRHFSNLANYQMHLFNGFITIPLFNSLSYNFIAASFKTEKITLQLVFKS